MSPHPPHVSADGRLRRLLGEILGLDAHAIDDSTSPQTVESWDSLNHLNLVMAIEQEFGLSLSVDDALDMKSVDTIHTVLARHGVDG